MTKPLPRVIPPELQSPDPAVGAPPAAPRLAQPGAGKGHYNAHGVSSAPPSESYHDPGLLDRADWYDKDLQERVKGYKHNQEAFSEWVNDTVMASMIRIGDFVRSPGQTSQAVLKAAQEFLKLATAFMLDYQKNKERKSGGTS